MSGRRHAVIIDDEPDLCRFVASILQDHGFETSTANDARAGEDLVLERRPALVCLDLMMPGRSGVQLFSRLKRNQATQDIPIIMITGIREKLNIDWEEIALGLRRRRPDGFVEKPIDPIRLMGVVERVLSGEGEGVRLG